MKRKFSPPCRKAPFAVVLCAFLLAACVSEEDMELDIPAGETAEFLHLQIDADGTPVMLVEEGMYFTTNAELNPWDLKYQHLNVQSVVLARTAGGWASHPFRNVRRNGVLRSMLVRNSEDRIQALIADRDKASLYARAGGGWNLKAAGRVPGGDDSPPLFVGLGELAFMTEADGRWQYIVNNYATHRIEIRRNDGTVFTMDTLSSMSYFSPLHLVPREKSNMVFGFHQSMYYPIPPNAPETGFFSYTWNVGSAKPNPRKRKISDRNFRRLFFAKVQGMERVYAWAEGDTLAEYSMQGEDLTWLRDSVIPWKGRSGSKEEAGPDSGFAASADMAVDPNGCIHYFAPVPGTQDQFAGPIGQSGYIHGSECRADVDTLKPPVPDTAFAYYYRYTPFRFTPDGGIAVGLILTQTPRPGNIIDGAPRSWIYLATLKGRAWEMEKALELEGSGIEERPY